MNPNILVLSFAAFVAIFVCSAIGQERANATPNRLEFSIESRKAVYFVSEPWQITIHVNNPTNQTAEIPRYIGQGYSLEIRDLDAKNGPDEKSAIVGHALLKSEPDGIELDAGQSKEIALQGSEFEFESGESCPGIGRWGIKYVYHGERWPNPQWESNEIEVECVVQPLSFPKETPENIRLLVEQIEFCGIESSRPGWTDAIHNDAMKQLIQLGNESVPALLANMNNYERQLAIFEMVGELEVESAVPELLAALQMRDNLHDRLIIAKLAEITKLEEGYSFHRGWFDSDTRETAVRSYQKWWDDRQSKGASKND